MVLESWAGIQKRKGGSVVLKRFSSNHIDLVSKEPALEKGGLRKQIGRYGYEHVFEKEVYCQKFIERKIYNKRS